MKTLLIQSMQKLDIVIWIITLLFFIGSALIMGGDIVNSFLGASGIIVLMFLVGFSIELILSALKNVKGVGAITGFITNGPEALVLIVGLIGGNVLFAASTPLGSNVMNPVLLVIALFITGAIYGLKKMKHKSFFITSFTLTAFFATVFFFIPESYYLHWLVVSLVVSIILFRKQFDHEDIVEDDEKVNKLYMPLGITILLFSGFFLDPIVSFTAEASQAPKGLIGFLVLATLTSWPEFKSVLALLRRNKVQDAFINILVSNITNLWLAITGVAIWMFMK